MLFNCPLNPMPPSLIAGYALHGGHIGIGENESPWVPYSATVLRSVTSALIPARAVSATFYGSRVVAALVPTATVPPSQPSHLKAVGAITNMTGLANPGSRSLRNARHRTHPLSMTLRA